KLPLILNNFPVPLHRIHSQKLAKLSQNCLKTPQFGLPVSILLASSLAWRFSFCNASRFICSFICEYFLNTFASVWRSNCVTHSSATTLALSQSLLAAALLCH